MNNSRGGRKENFVKQGTTRENIKEDLGISKEFSAEKEHEHDNGKQILDLYRPTSIKVHRKHVSPEMVEEFELPWM